VGITGCWGRKEKAKPSDIHIHHGVTRIEIRSSDWNDTEQVNIRSVRTLPQRFPPACADLLATGMSGFVGPTGLLLASE
jgi:hypothetical protein